MSAKKASGTVKMNDEPNLETFIATWEKGDTRQNVMTRLRLEGDEGKKILNKMVGRCRNYGLDLKSLSGGGGRGRTANVEAMEIAYKAMAKARGVSVDQIQKEAMALREERKAAAKAKKAEKAEAEAAIRAAG